MHDERRDREPLSARVTAQDAFQPVDAAPAAPGYAAPAAPQYNPFTGQYM